MCGAGSRWPLCLRVCGESQEPPGRGWVDRERPHQCSWPRCRCCQDSPRGTSWAQGSTVIYPWETRTLDRQEGLAELIVHPEHGTLLWDVWAPSLLGQAHLMHKKKGTSQMPNGPGPRGDSVQERDRQTLSGGGKETDWWWGQGPWGAASLPFGVAQEGPSELSPEGAGGAAGEDLGEQCAWWREQQCPGLGMQRPREPRTRDWAGACREQGGGGNTLQTVKGTETEGNGMVSPAHRRQVSLRLTSPGGAALTSCPSASASPGSAGRDHALFTRRHSKRNHPDLPRASETLGSLAARRHSSSYYGM
uniref:uncharacterized protein LOC120886514 isoform X1 n=1 Tax=Ictidomys tridecemlineatus TaxID=43179 RepID=UPI001A9D4006|nr:uncharacterized protein LOC120886514 isoform X1 [Ictidomys tridecemlineatus]XP_040131488.1 uncharacterized protein LOC120886514 isoform X1 [Ictidomys tridecemlineatus]